MQDANQACEQYDDKVEVSLYFDEPDGRSEVEGGKDEICAYLKKGQAAFVFMNASVSTSLHDMQVRPSGFPFLKATATYRQTSEIIMQPDGSPFAVKMSSVSDDKLEIKRTLTGLKITKMHGTGKVKVKPA